MLQNQIHQFAVGDAPQGEPKGQGAEALKLSGKRTAASETPGENLNRSPKG